MNTLNKSIQNFQEYLKIFSSGIEKGAHLTRLAVQEPLGRSHERMVITHYQNLSNIFFTKGHMILKASFGNRTKDGTSKDFMPYFGTDYGICSVIKPQVSCDWLERSLNNKADV